MWKILDSTVAALAVVCLVQATSNYKSLSNPVLLALEESAKESVVNVKPPPLEYEPSTFEERFKEDTYKSHLNMYYHKDDLYHKIWWLSIETFAGFKNAVVEDVLTNMKDKLKARSEQEAKRIILGACDALNREARSALAEVRALVNGWPREDFVRRDENLLRVVNLSNFCQFSK